MKNKSAVLFVLGLVLLGLSVNLHAAGERGAKQVTAITQTLNTIGISSTTATVYAVLLGTGAVTDFLVLFDSNSVGGLTNAQVQSGNFRMRFYSTATANSIFNFDPPLQFNNGIVAMNSTALGSAMITWEKGRVVEGY